MSDLASEHRPPATADSATTLHYKWIVHEYTRDSNSFFSRRSDAPTIRALDGISLSVSTGEFVAITGPSGSGKSTLLHLLAVLDAPTRSDIRTTGIDVRSLSNRGRAKLRRNTIGIVFQHFHLLPSLSARGSVALPLIKHGAPKHDRRAHAEDLLEQAGLGDRVGHKPGGLSGGEQRRVAIARALVSDPTVLIADEPTGKLDIKANQRVFGYIERTATEQAVVVATHGERVIERTNHVVRLHDGRVVSDS